MVYLKSRKPDNECVYSSNAVRRVPSSIRTTTRLVIYQKNYTKQHNVHFSPELSSTTIVKATGDSGKIGNITLVTADVDTPQAECLYWLPGNHTKRRIAPSPFEGLHIYIHAHIHIYIYIFKGGRE